MSEVIDPPVRKIRLRRETMKFFQAAGTITAGSYSASCAVCTFTCTGSMNTHTECGSGGCGCSACTCATATGSTCSPHTTPGCVATCNQS
jgi:hypothetical protein